MSGTNRDLVASGVVTAAISNSMVSLLHRYTGRGPTRARTTIGENLIVCVMGATLTRGERSLVQGGKAEVVLHSRRAFQDTMQADAISAVQELSGRRVVAFMSNNHIDPDLAVEVFILEPLGRERVEDELVDGHAHELVDGHADQRVDGHARWVDGRPRLGGGHNPSSANAAAISRAS